MLFIFILVYITAYAVELTQPTLAGKLAIQNVGIINGALPLVWLTFLHYAVGVNFRWFHSIRIIMAVEAFLFILAFWTNSLHHLIYTNAEIVTASKFTHLLFTRAPFFWVHQIIVSAIMLVATVYIIKIMMNPQDLRRGQAAILLAAGGIPWSVYMLYNIMEFTRTAYIDFTPLATVISVVLVAISISQHTQSSTISMAHNKLIQDMNDLVIILDDAANIIDINDKALSTLSLTRSNCMGKSAEEVFKFWPDLLDQLNSPSADVIEIPFTDKKSNIWFALNSSPFSVDERNRPSQLISLHDITARKEAQTTQEVMLQISEAVNSSIGLKKLLKKIHQSISTLINSANFYIALYDEATKLYSFPYYVDETETDPPSSPLTDSLTDYVRRNNEPLMANRELQQSLHDAGEITIYGTISDTWLGVPLRTRGGVIGVCAVQTYRKDQIYTEYDLKLLHFISTYIANAIEKKRADDELSMLQTGIALSQDAIFITKPDGTIISVNPAFEKLYGFSAEEAFGNTPRILKSGDHPDEMYEEFWKTLLKKEVVAGELINKTKSGEKIEVESCVNPILDEEGTITGFLAIQRDVTDRKLKARKKSEQDKLETIQNLAGAIAHEFSQPLQILSLTANLIADAHSSSDMDEARELIKRIPDQVDRIAKLVDKVRNIRVVATKPYVQGTEIIDLEASGGVKEPDPGEEE